jgi:uncharacterized RDD family membrane protein YckC
MIATGGWAKVSSSQADSLLLDTIKSVETPEGIVLTLRPAGPVPRALAWALDLLLRGVLYFALLMLLAPFGGFGMGLFLVVLFLLEWFYPVLFEVLWKGQTPGKRALGLKVLMLDGTPVGWGAALLRSLLMAADFLPVCYGAGLASMLLQRDCRRLGDLAAGTLVVSAWERGAAAVEARPDCPAEAPTLPLSLEEQQALATFVERERTLSPKRAEELADLLEPLSGLTGPAAVARLKGMAAFIAGGP